MFAVVKTGGKQYKVAVGDKIKIEKINGEVGDIITLDQVLMIGKDVGEPTVKGASVAVALVEQVKQPKVIAFKKRRRKNSKRTIGHRQKISLVQVTELLTDNKKPTKKAPLVQEKNKKKKVEEKKKAKAEPENKKTETKKIAKSDNKTKTKTKSETKAKAKPAAKKKPTPKAATSKKPTAKKTAKPTTKKPAKPKASTAKKTTKTTKTTKK